MIRHADARPLHPEPLTLADRVDAYNRAYVKWPASHLRIVEEQGAPTIYGMWQLGNDYRNAGTFYGEYPRGYLDRVMALFPDVEGCDVLHAFSGSLPAGPYFRCDVREIAEEPVEYPCSVYDLPELAPTGDIAFRLVLADPPYSSADAAKYGTAMVNRGRTTRALAQVTRVGGHLVWLDTVWPMHRKSEWRTCGRIALIRSTNHRVRLISILERQP